MQQEKRYKKPNSGSVEPEFKNKRLNLRASDTTVQKLRWITDCSDKCRGKSDAEIIAYLVDEHVLMQELYHYHLPRFKKVKNNS